MKTQLPLRTLVMVAWGLFVITLTTQSERVPLVHLMIALFGRTEFGATLGHASLFGLLTLAVYLALALKLPRRYALLLAMTLAISLGTLTELAQQLVADRTSSLSDLLANWLGVFVVAFAVLYLVASSKLTRQPQR